ncbi:MAG: hypothetical protein Q4P72_05825, partial [Eubacteriales bacterium]|nr:hypothetical protein [Eubacteriales bacterium]
MELEFKFGFDPDQGIDFDDLSKELLARSFAMVSQRRHRRMSSHYYLVKSSTSSDDEAILCRLRSESGTWVLTLKSTASTTGSLHKREEFELSTSLDFSEEQLSPAVEISQLRLLLSSASGSGDL